MGYALIFKNHFVSIKNRQMRFVHNNTSIGQI